uniref:ATP synthase subunit b 1 n=1 Tax=Anthurium amnicola TaxID=1678845 RepID=A0A1D1Z517_9ARAE
MASTQLPDNTPHHVRSISLPSRSHPLSVRVEEGLHKLKAWATSSLPQSASPSEELLCVGLQALEEMYDCAEELLRQPHTQRVLARHQDEKWAAGELDSSVRLLDICGTTRDSVSSIKEQAQGLESALRTRRGGDSTVETKTHALVQSRKKAHKDASKCFKALKQMEDRKHAHLFSAADEGLWLAVRALKDLREITVAIFRSILAFISVPTPVLAGKMRRWPSMRSIHGRISGKEVDLEKVTREEQRRLQALEMEMGSLETGLESMFRRLIQNRVSLLNIFSL